MSELPAYTLRVDFTDAWTAFCNFDIFFRHQSFLYLAALERKRAGASHFLSATLIEAHFLDDLVLYCRNRSKVCAVTIIPTADYDLAPAEKVWQLYRPRHRRKA